MNITKLAVLAALGACLTLPAVSQTMQTSPTKPSSPSVSPPASTGTGAAPAPRSTTSSSSLLDINTASEEQLDALPGIGKSRAEAIIKNRPYKGKDDLVNRHVIPPNIYQGIKDKIIAKQG